MKILAVVLARGGSKRLPGKNIRKLGNKPLIAWTINAAKNIARICDIIVSTDDPAIGKAALEAGASVPWMRPSELATDTAGTAEVALHALDWYETTNGPVDGLLILQPTSPFRTRQTIERGIDLFADSSGTTVLAVSKVHAHPAWMFRITNKRLTPFLQNRGNNLRSQDLEPLYVSNGSLYLVRPKTLRDTKSHIAEPIVPLIIESELEVLDIDMETDFKIAEALCESTCFL